MRPILIGAVIVGLIPVLHGTYVIYRSAAYAAELPEDVAICATPAVAALVSNVVGGPVFALIGGVAAWGVTGLYALSIRAQSTKFGKQHS